MRALICNLLILLFSVIGGLAMLVALWWLADASLLARLLASGMVCFFLVSCLGAALEIRAELHGA